MSHSHERPDHEAPKAQVLIKIPEMGGDLPSLCVEAKVSRELAAHLALEAVEGMSIPRIKFIVGPVSNR